MFWNLVRAFLVAGIVVTVAEISKRYPRAGGLLLALPLISVLAILATWFQHRDLPAISRLSRETLVLVPLGLPFFVPLAFAPRLGLAFWPAFAMGLVLASISTSAWLALTGRA